MPYLQRPEKSRREPKTVVPRKNKIFASDQEKKMVWEEEQWMAKHWGREPDPKRAQSSDEDEKIVSKQQRFNPAKAKHIPKQGYEEVKQKKPIYNEKGLKYNRQIYKDPHPVQPSLEFGDYKHKFDPDFEKRRKMFETEEPPTHLSQTEWEKWLYEYHMQVDPDLSKDPMVLTKEEKDNVFIQGKYMGDVKIRYTREEIVRDRIEKKRLELLWGNKKEIKPRKVNQNINYKSTGQNISKLQNSYQSESDSRV